MKIEEKDHMCKTPNDAQPAATSMATVVVSEGDDVSYAMDPTTCVEVNSAGVEPHAWVVYRVEPTFVPATTYFDTFCDLWAPLDDITASPVDVGYGALLGDAQRIRGYFDKAMATVAGLESRKG